MRVRVALAQLNQIVGDYEKNTENIKKAILKAKENNADIILFPELALNGYPPEDLIIKTSYLKDSLKYIEQIRYLSEGTKMLIVCGYVEWDVESYNSAIMIYDGKILDSYRKMFLPNYSVFDEKRYFIPGDEISIIQMDSIKIGITICEDIWVPQGPALTLSKLGANIILNLSASPFNKGKTDTRTELLKTRSSELSSWIVYCNLMGGQDEVVFDGGSIVLSPYGDVELKAPNFEEGVYFIDIDPYEATRANLKEGKRKHYLNYNSVSEENIKVVKIAHEFRAKQKNEPIISDWGNDYYQLYSAIKLGIKDYMGKNGFKKAVLGLSGGIDSALVAAIAADAVGKENVLGIMMPSQYSSSGSIDDSVKLANNLGIETKTIPIKNIYDALISELEPHFEGKPVDTTEENLQARIRGILNMSFSNKFGYIVLSTGNKSEVATGYATLYGDMAGGFSPIKDLYKTEVYKVCEEYNKIHGSEVIPTEIFIKAPSAELRPDQKDQDSLPEYDLLDEILSRYIDREMSFDEIVEEGFDSETVKFIIRLVDLNEYKRRQGAPGVKLTSRSFGKERRMPITNGYKIWKTK